MIITFQVVFCIFLTLPKVDPFKQGLSQDLETVPEIWQLLMFWPSNDSNGTTIYSDFKTYTLIEIRHNVLIRWHGNYIMMKKFVYMLEMVILRNSSQKDLGVLRGNFSRVWVSKRRPAG